MKKMNIDKFINIIFILYIVVYIALLVEIYFINNTNLLITYMLIEFNLMTIELICSIYTKEKNSKYKALIVALLHCIKYPLLLII
ncbi:hypothetical protein NSA50_18125 [Clostridium sp. DSM 100503]|uniref:hypothetical protein n=1 Tax=Clostridium sp. DSM 100503 TaxID=2963282 RepID=UPI002149E0F5|nr:hypothetical protein [Clostridium sp. DSM 100503]MCR1952923.1 hypothetical protein [Clostridium sp. DSM 100503]